MPKTDPANEDRKRRRGEEFARRLNAYVQQQQRDGKFDEVTDGKIARATGIDRSTITRIRNGERPATADQILGIAKSLGVPDLVPPEMEIVGPKASDTPPRVSGPPSTLPPGLGGFLERHASRLKISKRLLFYLEHDRTQTEPWLVKDDAFWERRLKFWTTELAIQDKATSVPGSEDSD